MLVKDLSNKRELQIYSGPLCSTLANWWAPPPYNSSAVAVLQSLVSDRDQERSQVRTGKAAGNNVDRLYMTVPFIVVST